MGLLTITTPLAVVAIAVIIVGLAISLGEYSDAKHWVENGFWGTSDKYWKANRDTLSEQMNTAKALANPSHAEHSIVKEYFEAELAYHLDINAKLTIADAKSHDGIIEIHCLTLQSAADLDRLSVEVYFDPSGIQWGYHTIKGVTTTWLAPGIAQVRIPSGNYRIEDNEVFIEVELDRIPYDKFTAEKTLRSRTLW